MNNISVLRLSEAHISEVAALEKENFPCPWSEQSLYLLCKEDYPSFVACSERGEVVGYIGMSRVLDELQILDLAVSQYSRRRGVASALLERVDEYAAAHGILSASLEVRASNTAAIALYEKYGFLTVGQRRNFYSAPTEDAKVMVKQFK